LVERKINYIKMDSIIFDIYQIDSTCLSGEHKVVILQGDKVTTRNLDDQTICNLLLNLSKEIPVHFQKFIDREKWEPRFDSHFFQRRSDLIVNLCSISSVCHFICGSQCRHAVKVKILDVHDDCLLELGGEKITYLLVKFKRKVPDHFLPYLCCDEVVRLKRMIPADKKGVCEDNLALRYDMC
jgi:hypothetical protein